jgi:hypothetical protein
VVQDSEKASSVDQIAVVEPPVPEEMVEFNLIVPPRDALFEDIKLPKDSTIDMALDYGQRYFDVRYGVTYVVINIEDVMFDGKALIRDVPAQRDLFVREGVKYSVESRLDHFAAQDFVFPVSSPPSIKDLRARIGECEICDRYGVVYKDDQKIERRDYLLAVSPALTVELEVVYLNGKAESFRVENLAVFKDFRPLLIDKNETNAFVAVDQTGESIDSECPLGQIGGNLVRLIPEGIRGESASGTRMEFEIDGKHFVVHVAAGSTVGDAAHMIAELVGRSDDDVAILFAGRVLESDTVVGRLDIGEQKFGVSIRLNLRISKC